MYLPNRPASVMASSPCLSVVRRQAGCLLKARKRRLVLAQRAQRTPVLDTSRGKIGTRLTRGCGQRLRRDLSGVANRAGAIRA